MEVENQVSEPSRVAIWLIMLFGAGEQGQAVLGDLLEEFSYQRLKMPSSAAQRWFWRQALWTVVYLVRREFRSAPVTIVALGDVLAIQSMLMATSYTGDRGYLWTIPWTFAFSFAVIVGGATVRMVRMRRDIAGKTQTSIHLS